MATFNEKKIGVTERGSLPANVVEEELTIAKKKLNDIQAKIAEIDKKIRALQVEKIQRETKNNELKAKRSKLNQNRMQKGFKEKEADLIRQENVEVKRLNKIPQEIKKLEAERAAANQEFKRAAEYAKSWEKKLENSAKENASGNSSKETTKKQVKDDEGKAKVAKEDVKKRKLTSRPRPIPQEVLDAAKESGAHIVYLEDEKGNRIYQLRVGKEPNGKTQSVMTEIKGGEIFGPIETKNSKEVKDLLNKIRGKAGKKGADFSDVITEMTKQVETATEIQEVTVVGDKNKVKKNSIIVPEIKAPEMPKEIKIKYTPTVTLVPHTKKNGKPSKRNYDIQLMDADGKKVTLTKEKFKEMVSTKGPNSAARADTSWDAYIEAAKAGNLQPEVVASYFKGQVNMGEDKQFTASELQQMKSRGGR